MRFLAAYDWPGNLPELKNEMTRMLVYAQDPVLGSELISRHILQAKPGGTDPEEDAVLTGTGGITTAPIRMKGFIMVSAWAPKAREKRRKITLANGGKA